MKIIEIDDGPPRFATWFLVLLFFITVPIAAWAAWKAVEIRHSDMQKQCPSGNWKRITGVFRDMSTSSVKFGTQLVCVEKEENGR